MIISQKLLNLLQETKDDKDFYFCPQCGFKTLMHDYDYFECLNYQDCNLAINYNGADDELLEWQKNTILMLKSGLLVVYDDAVIVDDGFFM